MVVEVKLTTHPSGLSSTLQLTAEVVEQLRRLSRWKPTFRHSKNAQSTAKNDTDTSVAVS